MLVRWDNGSYVDSEDPGEQCYRTPVPRVSVTDDEAKILAEYATGKRVLEIGTGLGISTRAMAAVAHSLTTVDVDPWVHDAVWPTLEGTRRVTEVPAGEEFDVVFIDAEHSNAAVKRDIEAALRCSPSLLLFHDIYATDVSSAVESYFPNVKVLKTTHGIGVVEL